MPGPILAPVRPAFRLLARAICPDVRRLDAAGWDEVEALVERALADRPAAMQRQFATFVRLLMWLPVPVTGRPFMYLPPDLQVAFLHRVERSRFSLLRRGLWGLRTLVFLGVYARPAGRAATGWRGHRDGWDARRGPDAPPPRASHLVPLA